MKTTIRNSSADASFPTASNKRYLIIFLKFLKSYGLLLAGLDRIP